MNEVKIPLSRGLFATVDACDADNLLAFKWYASETHGIYYAVRTIKAPSRRTLSMHRVIMNAPKQYFVDHKNRDGLDNRRKNLRLVSDQQNKWNAKKSKASTQRFKGIRFDARSTFRPWIAILKIDGKTKHLGCFRTDEEAARAYDAKVREVRGEFGLLNFPNDPVGGFCTCIPYCRMTSPICPCPQCHRRKS